MASIFGDDSWTHEDKDGNRYTVVTETHDVSVKHRGLNDQTTVSRPTGSVRLSTGEEVMSVNNWTYEIIGTGVQIFKRKSA